MPAEATHSEVSAAYREATRAKVPAIAQRLQELLGQQLVAYAIGVSSPKMVGRWAKGTPPHPGTELKLRNLYRTVLILLDSVGPQTVRAWLQGANPDLADVPPVEVLREGRDVEVFHAAESFTR